MEAQVLTEEQKRQLEELQLFKNKEGNVTIEVTCLLINQSNSIDIYIVTFCFDCLILWL